MTVSYFDNNKKRFREPVFQKTRAIYKGNRISEIENLNNESLLVDINRLYLEIENIDTSILDKLNYFIGGKAISNIFETNNDVDDGIIYKIDNINFYHEPTDVTQSPLQINTIGHISSIVFRLKNKIKRLENGN